MDPIADKILVLDKGRLVASGKHEELMESSEIYAEIYRSQLVGDTPVTSATPTDAEEEAAIEAASDAAAAEIVAPVAMHLGATNGIAYTAPVIEASNPESGQSHTADQ